MEVQGHYKYYEEQIEDQANIIVAHEEMNTILSDRGRFQERAINNFIIVRSLCDAALTRSTAIQKQLSSKLDKTRIKLKLTQQELDATQHKHTRESRRKNKLSCYS